MLSRGLQRWLMQLSRFWRGTLRFYSPIMEAG
jgi:hypothetical protein